MTARRLTDSVRSSRVFSESDNALPAALDEVSNRGIKHVVLLGDYSDDGQTATLSALRNLLDRYRQDHGLEFIATVGNHDIFGPDGRHHAKRLLNPDGTYTLVASDGGFVDDDAEGMVLTDKMYCPGYPEGLHALSDIGFFRKNSDIHWETPFGTDSDPATRLYTVCSHDHRNEYRLMDASYLIEPVHGLWLLMIDANVFEPRNGDFAEGNSGAFVDSTNAGWNAMLKHKRFVIDWTKDVAQRARREGKLLLAFSHYPAIDMMSGTAADERALIGKTNSTERVPTLAVAEALISAGISVHFSGHLHVNDTARIKRDENYLINVGVPSLVAFPPAFKIVSFAERSLHIETVSLDHLAVDPLLMGQYRTELSVTGKKVGKMIEAASYGDFICEHVDQLLVHRYLRREWPKDLAGIVPQLNLGDLVFLASCRHPVALADAVVLILAERQHADSVVRVRAILDGSGVTLEQLDAILFPILLGDLYRLRFGREMAFDRIPASHVYIYRILIALYANDGARSAGEAQVAFARLLRMMGCYLSGLPSRNFTIDVTSGAINRDTAR